MRGGAAVVQAPPAEPPRLGLVAAARTPTDPADIRWENGLRYAPENCGSSGIVDPCATHTKTIPANAGEVQFEPYVVWAGDKCAPFHDERDWRGRADRQLRSCESQQIEAEFWSGVFAQSDEERPNVFLTNGDAEEITAGAATAVNALAALEDALGVCSCGSRGMIHATRGVATIWAERGLLRRETNLLLTPMDTIVVPGSGYDGSGPQGEAAADGSVWAYATGMVDVRRSKIEIFPDTLKEATDRATNLVEYRAERYAAATFDACCFVAAEINAPAPPLGIGS